MSEQRSQAWSQIKEALRLDASGQDEEAFAKYLEGVQKLCGYIKEETTLQDLKGNDSARINVMKVIATMKESLARVEDIISRPVVKSSDKVVELRVPENPQPSATFFRTYTESQRLSPLEIARQQNQRLERSYGNRLIKSVPQRVNLSLELHRRMQENLSLAKEKESKLRLEQAKRESEALQLAASKLSRSCVESQMPNSHQSWSNKVALCACVLHYKPEDNWMETFSKQFRGNPSQALVTAAVRKILRMPKHPLTCWLFGKQQNLKARLSVLLDQHLSAPPGDQSEDQQLREIAEQASSVLETFLQVFGVCLDLAQYPDFVDESYSALEQIFFQDLWPTISQLYRVVYQDEEALLASACRRYKSGTDTDVNICDLLTLPAETLDTLFVDLHQFSANCSPLAKVQSLVEMTHVLCDNDKALKYEKVLSADDLIGLVSCLLVQSNMPHLFAEIQALENFIPHRFLMGEEGYSLTTFLTAVKYLESQGDGYVQNNLPAIP